MNFLLHRHLAARDLDSAAAGCGAMLPDLWRMNDRRVRPAPVTIDGDHACASVLAGIDHHLDRDRWFHRAPLFIDGEKKTAETFRAAAFNAPRMGLLAHVAWELCLDGALVRREGVARIVASVAESFAGAGEAADRAALLHHFDRVDRTASERAAFFRRMRLLEERLVDGAWIAAYSTGPGLAEVISRIRERLGLDPLGTADLDRLASTFGPLLADADVLVDALLSAGIRDAPTPVA